RVEQLQGDARLVARLDALVAFAEARGHTVLELAFAWLLAHPAVSCVIAGVSDEAQIEANAAAADWELSRDERDEVDAIGAWDGTGNEVEEPGGHSMKPVR